MIRIIEYDQGNTEKIKKIKITYNLTIQREPLSYFGRFPLSFFMHIKHFGKIGIVLVHLRILVF